MSLPFLFYKSKIKRKPLKIEDINFKKVRKKYPTRILKLMDDKKLNVGIAWSGRCSQTRNSFRSVRLDFLKQILNNKKINFFVLQKISNIQDHEIINQIGNLHDLSDYLKDFTDTASFLSRMDFVISSCTSLVHLSAMLNKKTLLLLSKIHDPRWNEKNNGVLYKCVKKFKQKELNNWYHPVEEVKEFLQLKTNCKDLLIIY